MFGLKESHLSIPKVNKIDRRVIQGANKQRNKQNKDITMKSLILAQDER